MELIFTFLSSSTAKWVSILLCILAFVGYFYYTVNQLSDLKSQAALYQYNINQLNEIIKTNKEYIRHMEEISKAKSDIINDLYKKNDALEEKTKQIEVDIEKEVVKGNDRPASNILKETIRKLGSF